VKNKPIKNPIPLEKNYTAAGSKKKQNRKTKRSTGQVMWAKFDFKEPRRHSERTKLQTAEGEGRGEGGREGKNS